MKVKDGVITEGLHWRMGYAWALADLLWNRHGKALVVTSGLDGVHSQGSKHYLGRAIDLRTRYFGKDEVDVVVEDLRAALPNGYDVVVHPTHIHVEYDPKGGEAWDV